MEESWNVLHLSCFAVIYVSIRLRKHLRFPDILVHIWKCPAYYLTAVCSQNGVPRTLPILVPPVQAHDVIRCCHICPGIDVKLTRQSRHFCDHLVGWWQEGHPAVKPRTTAMITTSHILSVKLLTGKLLFMQRVEPFNKDKLLWVKPTRASMEKRTL